MASATPVPVSGPDINLPVPTPHADLDVRASSIAEAPQLTPLSAASPTDATSSFSDALTAIERQDALSALREEMHMHRNGSRLQSGSVSSSVGLSSPMPSFAPPPHGYAGRASRLEQLRRQKTATALGTDPATASRTDLLSKPLRMAASFSMLRYQGTSGGLSAPVDHPHMILSQVGDPTDHGTDAADACMPQLQSPSTASGSSPQPSSNSYAQRWKAKANSLSLRGRRI